jgi:threonine/homoserine/homoserine lactone efflux protein
MNAIENFPLFVAAAIALNLMPGQDTLYILGQSLARGRGAGVSSALGISAGSMVHTVAAALGLSVILSTSALAFEAVKWAGALYLIVLGIRLFLERAESPMPVNATAEQPSHTWDAAAFQRGVLTNVLNPKVAVFFLAFLPQFVAPDAQNPVVPFLLLGSTFVLTGTVWCVVLALTAARFSAGVRANPNRLVWMRRGSGALFVGLGLHLSLTPSPASPT